MPQFEQFTFEAGEIGTEHIWRADLAVRAASASSLKNCRLKVSGSAVARAGTVQVAAAAGDARLQAMTVGELAYFLVLSNARVRIYDKATRALVQDISGCAWTTTELPDLVTVPYGDECYVLHQGMPSQVIRRAAAGTWSVAAFTFADGLGSTKRQPYYRFAAPGLTITPSARTGSITLTASAAYFVSGHVGLRLRLQGREVQITAVTNATTATATVIQELYPTVTINVASSAGFEAGEIIVGKDSLAEAEVVSTGSGTITAILLKFTDFYYDATNSKGEVVVGRNASTTTDAAQSTTTNAPVLAWDEQAISALRGYPGTGTVHKNRLWLARLPLVPFGVLASAIGALDDFGVGIGDADAIFEELGDESVGAIRHIKSAPQLLLLTERRLFYFPETEDNPIRPTAFSLLEIGPDGASTCKPVGISEGVMFAETGGRSIIGAFQTGDVRRSWRSADVSPLSSHLIQAPRSMAYISGLTTGPERYVYVVNENGSMACVYYSDAAEMFGWTPWETEGQFRAVDSVDGECWAIVAREVNGSTLHYIEAFDEDAVLDCSVAVDPVDDLQGDATDETISTPDGVLAAEKVYRCAAHPNATVSLMVGDAYIGEVVTDAQGDFGGPDTTETMTLGYKWDAQCVPWPPMPAQDDRARRRKVRITRALVRWRGRYMSIDGKLLPPYRADEDLSEAPPLRDELSVKACFGWSHEPTVTFARAYPGPWEVLGYSFEVTR